MAIDRLVLMLLRRDAQNAWRSLSWSDAAWIVGGGGLLLAYVIADVWYQLGLQAAKVGASQISTTGCQKIETPAECSSIKN